MNQKEKQSYAWLNGLIILAGVPIVLVLGVTLWKDRNYNLVSMIIVLLALVPNCYSFEKHQANTRKMILIAVMTALSVAGRSVFAWIPFFKPVTAIVVITAMYFGAEAGFLTGALSAVISNFFFGQGPWTPFQMFSWGVIGFLAGLPVMQKLLKRKLPLMIYGGAAGVMFSLLMDIWSTLFMDGIFRWKRYAVLVISALPVSIIYVVSNVVFLLLLQKPIGEKLERIKVKYDIS